MSSGTAPSWSFNGVGVSLPTKVRGNEAEEEWQEVDWVTWSSGTVRVDSDGWLLTFTPTEAPRLAAKSLGSLVSSKAYEDAGGNTLVVRTDDPVQQLYRLTFENLRHVRDFLGLAKSAEEARSFDVGDDQEDDSAEIAELEASIWEQLDARWGEAGAGADAVSTAAPPLVYSAVELYGAARLGTSSGDEVLIGRGAVVLQDPPEGSQVGSYELLFYSLDDGAAKAASRIVLGPRTTIKELPRGHRDSGADGTATFEFLPMGKEGLRQSLVFDRPAVAASFARDLRIRARLMRVSLKTAAGQRAVTEVQGRLADLQAMSLAARTWRGMVWLVLLLVVFVAARVATMYGFGQETDLAKIPTVLGVEFSGIAGTAAFVASSVSAQVCAIATDAVPASDVRRCYALAVRGSASAAAQAATCLELLIGSV